MVLLLADSVFGLSSEIEMFKVFPNPTSSTVTLNIVASDISSELKVFDICGKLVFKAQLNESSYKLDMSAWTGGVYFFRIENGDKMETKRIIKL